jgi:hypothetical protein
VYYLISGYMGEVMLIQMSFIKKELLVAMGAIDELLRGEGYLLGILALLSYF